ncbi:MAG: TRAP transporter substrate-binding protein DctP [Pseudomonadota bacterium]
MWKLRSMVLAAALLSAPAAIAEDRISFVTNWGSDFYSSAFMVDWAKKFNEEHKGVAQINYVGGPEVTPAREQLSAMRNGVFDMMFGAAGYYVGQVPEGYVFYPTTWTPRSARERGATHLLAAIYAEKANAELLGWVASGVGYNLWLKDADVPVDENGVPDLSGLKIRSSPLYNTWLQEMGATVVPVPAPDIYSALERGVVDGAAWPALGVTDFGWNKFIGARVDPKIWQFDNVLLVNKDRWDALSDETKAALKESVAALEAEAHAHYEGLVEKEKATVEEGGTSAFALEGDAEAAYVGAANDIMWNNLKEASPEHYEALRAAFGGS